MSSGGALNLERLYAAVREVRDFPRPGIVFKDITPLLLDPEGFRAVVQEMAARYRDQGVTRVVAIESRGFLVGAPIALQIAAGLVPIRKPGKLPARRGRVDYALEYGTDALEMHSDAVGAGDRVLIVDDVLATGGTAEAAGKLVREHGAQVVGYSFLIELAFLAGRSRLQGTRIEALLRYA